MFILEYLLQSKLFTDVSEVFSNANPEKEVCTE
jgi:hypothetical protein